MKLRIIELFAGIGACSKALENLGIDLEIVDAVEIDKYAIASFNAIHNTNFEVQDIKTYNKTFENIDLITHGSPCQDFSIAGRQAGGDKDSGTRSSLMYETLRIVEKIKPKYVLWENVKNILSKKHRHNFDKYLEKMEQLGYKNYYQVLNAKDYGIPQNRERVFTVSILGNVKFEFPLRKECNNKIIEHNPNGKHQQDLIQDEQGLCRCIPGGTHGSTPHLLKTVVRNFDFPPKKELNLKLKDLLEDEVDEKYYLSEKMLNGFLKHNKNHIEKRTGFVWKPKSENDIANCLRANASLCPTDNTIAIKNATKKGHDKAVDGDSVNLQHPNSTTRRGRVGHQVSQTLMTSDNMGVIENLKIRKLTPKECWRLMGFDDEDFEKAKNIPTSNTQLYKQAGNSIVVNVLVKIFTNLLKKENEKMKIKILM